MESVTIAETKPTARAQLTNGSRPFQNADGRSSDARLLRDRERDLALPLGGWANLSTGERALVGAAAALTVRLEAVRSGLARGESGIADEDLLRLTNGLTRALGAIDKAGVRRRAKSISPTPTLDRYRAERGEAA